MTDNAPLLRFDSTTTFTGLDFIARSLAQMEHNGTDLCPDDVAGNMTEEQRTIFMARLMFHRGKFKVRCAEGS